jgi:hypothetical protein
MNALYLIHARLVLCMIFIKSWTAMAPMELACSDGFREPYQIWWVVAQPFRSYIGAKNDHTFDGKSPIWGLFSGVALIITCCTRAGTTLNGTSQNLHFNHISTRGNKHEFFRKIRDGQQASSRATGSRRAAGSVVVQAATRFDST